ncbi:alpha/beta hydrolase [Candidatus Saccharibacteria bacterium]|nr:alpha/beta hydrolase [Candidatus Saccharibacteria bacterium]
MSNHIIIYSHGFGVRADNRGMFTEIAAQFPAAEHIIFDYNKIDKAKKTVTVTPLDEQAKMLTDIFNQAKQDNPTAIIDIITHSQGGTIAAMAQLDARRTILLAPPLQILNSGDKVRYYLEHRPGAVVTDDMATIPRRDGTTTIIGADYWRSYNKIPDLTPLCNELAKLTKLTILVATEDEVVDEQDYSGLADDVKLIEIRSDHNFKDTARQEMIDIVKGIIDEPTSKKR